MIREALGLALLLGSALGARATTTLPGESATDRAFLVRCSRPAPAVADYNPTADIRGTSFEARYVRAFYGSLSPAETCAIAYQIRAEARDLEAVSAAGLSGVWASFLAISLSPVFVLLGVLSGWFGASIPRTAGLFAIVAAPAHVFWATSHRLIWTAGDIISWLVAGAFGLAAFYGIAVITKRLMPR